MRLICKCHLSASIYSIYFQGHSHIEQYMDTVQAEHNIWTWWWSYQTQYYCFRAEILLPSSKSWLFSEHIQMKNTVWAELEGSSYHSVEHQVTDAAVKILDINSYVERLQHSITFSKSNNLGVLVRDVYLCPRDSSYYTIPLTFLGWTESQGFSFNSSTFSQTFASSDHTPFKSCSSSSPTWTRSSLATNVPANKLPESRVTHCGHWGHQCHWILLVTNFPCFSLIEILLQLAPNISSESGSWESHSTKTQQVTASSKSCHLMTALMLLTEYRFHLSKLLHYSVRNTFLVSKAFLIRTKLSIFHLVPLIPGLPWLWQHCLCLPLVWRTCPQKWPSCLVLYQVLCFPVQVYSSPIQTAALRNVFLLPDLQIWSSSAKWQPTENRTLKHDWRT